MNIELGKLGNGGLVLMSDAPFPHPISSVEYYSEQKLLMLVYDEPGHEGDLMHYELAEHATDAIKKCASILVVSVMPRRGLGGREVPLVRIN
jgi:hypothetical protein